MTTPRIGTTYAISDRTVTRFDGTMFSPMAFGTVQRWSVLVDGKLVRSGLRSKGAATTFARRWQRNVIDPRPVPVQPTPAPATHIIRAWDNTAAGETPLCGASRSLDCTIWPDECERERGLVICPACREAARINAREKHACVACGAVAPVCCSDRILLPGPVNPRCAACCRHETNYVGSP